MWKWKCEAVDVWKCGGGDVKMWRCGCVEMWMCRYEDLDMWNYRRCKVMPLAS